MGYKYDILINDTIFFIDIIMRFFNNNKKNYKLFTSYCKINNS